MSVDVFGRNLKKNNGSRGPPGFGFKITADGHYDLDNKRLCNLADPLEQNDAVNLQTLTAEIQKVRESMSRLEENLNNLDSIVEAHRDELDLKVFSHKKEIEAIKGAVAQIMTHIHSANV